jgi:hypothetical protein
MSNLFVYLYSRHRFYFKQKQNKNKNNLSEQNKCLIFVEHKQTKTKSYENQLR